MIYAVSTLKGGAGKTMLAAHLVGHLASSPKQRVLAIDADPQRALTLWLARALPDVATETPSTTDQICELFEDWDDAKRGHAVIDLSGGDPDLHRTAALCADVVIVPTPSGLLDVRMALATATLVRQARKMRGGKGPALKVVMSRVFTNARQTGEALDALRQHDMPVTEAVLTQRQAYSRCCSAGSLIWDQPVIDGEARDEMQRLMQELVKP